MSVSQLPRRFKSTASLAPNMPVSPTAFEGCFSVPVPNGSTRASIKQSLHKRRRFGSLGRFMQRCVLVIIASLYSATVAVFWKFPSGSGFARAKPTDAIKDVPATIKKPNLFIRLLLAVIGSCARKLHAVHA